MGELHPITVSALVAWVAFVSAALFAGQLSADAGTLAGWWVVAGFVLGLVLAGWMWLGVWFLPDTWSTAVRRAALLAGLSGAFWSAGTVTRAVHTVLYGPAPASQHVFPPVGFGRSR